MATRLRSSTGLRAFTIALRIVAAFAILTGLIDIVAGTAILPFMGATFAPGATDPVLDSQFRFLSATWFGYGLALWWVSNSLATRGAMLDILALAMFAGGMGRLIAIAVTGSPPAVIFAFLAIELVGPVAAVILHRRLWPHRGAMR